MVCGFMNGFLCHSCRIFLIALSKDRNLTVEIGSKLIVTIQILDNENLICLTISISNWREQQIYSGIPEAYVHELAEQTG